MGPPTRSCAPAYEARVGILRATCVLSLLGTGVLQVRQGQRGEPFAWREDSDLAVVRRRNDRCRRTHRILPARAKRR